MNILKRVSQRIRQYYYLPLFNIKQRKIVVDRYSNWHVPDLGFATVRDFCDSVDYLPDISRPDGTLKEVQRPWIIKAILSQVPLGGRLLEIGGGEPLVSSALSELGYAVSLIDPYDGSGNGPVDYARYRKIYPHVKIVRAYFEEYTPQLEEQKFDCIFSVSVLEHIPHGQLASLFKGVSEYLRPKGHSIHCVDLITQGVGMQNNKRIVMMFLIQQYKLQNPHLSDEQILSKFQGELDVFFTDVLNDVETYYNSPLGHNLWRNGRPYQEYPFRKMVSVQSCVIKAA